MINTLRKIHFWYFLTILIFFFGIFWPTYHLTGRSPKTYGILNFFRAIHSFMAAALAGIFFNIKYEQRLKLGKTYIYCANHTSILDIILFCLLAKGRFHFMGKEELVGNPVLRIFFKTIDISVNRESKISTFRAFKKAKENLDGGMSLIIFPEGKIGENYPPYLHPFKNGPFKLAIESNIEIVPVSIINLWKILWDDGVKGSRPGIVDVFVHKPIATGIFTAQSENDLKKKVFELINSKLKYEYQ